jgi:hypothetical protein
MNGFIIFNQNFQVNVNLENLDVDVKIYIKKALDCEDRR